MPLSGGVGMGNPFKSGEVVPLPDAVPAGPRTTLQNYTRRGFAVRLHAGCPAASPGAPRPVAEAVVPANQTPGRCPWALPGRSRSGNETLEAPVAQLDRALPSEGKGQRF